MRGRHCSGFTLIELMVAMAVVALLAAIAIPSYSAYVTRGQRAAAKAGLQQAAQWLERNYTASGCYNYTDAASCSAQAGNAVTAVWPFVGTPTDGGNLTYAIGAPSFPTPAGFPQGQYFIVTATPCGTAGGCPGGSTFTDPTCGALQLDSSGQQCILVGGTQTCAGSSTAAAATVAACWQH